MKPLGAKFEDYEAKDKTVYFKYKDISYFASLDSADYADVYPLYSYQTVGVKGAGVRTVRKKLEEIMNRPLSIEETQKISKKIRASAKKIPGKKLKLKEFIELN